jgi:hypothetical protein
MTRSERRHTQAKVNRLGLEYRCNGCGTHIATIGAGFASKKPMAASKMLMSAGTRHRAATGCQGTATRMP